MRTILSALTVLGMAFGTSALAQDLPGDPIAGRDFARQICAECHFVEREWVDLYVGDAPDFVDIANGSAHTEMSLRVFFVTPHLNMPNLILSEEQTDNVISWILSLREE